jgi:hypothetical protein
MPRRCVNSHRDARNVGVGTAAPLFDTEGNANEERPTFGCGTKANVDGRVRVLANKQQHSDSSNFMMK